MAFANRIKVVVLHGDPIVHAGLSTAFGKCADIEVQDTPEFPDGRAVQVLSSGPACPDVVVADYKSGVTLAVELARCGTSRTPKVVVIGSSDREWEIRSALEHGVRGYILLGSSLAELAEGVRAVHRGGRHLSGHVAGRLAESLGQEQLTGREEEVLELVVQGLCNKAIGRRLGIAVGTVKSHLKSAFDKLDVESRTQAIAAVERRGLLRRMRHPTNVDGSYLNGATAGQRLPPKAQNARGTLAAPPRP